MSLVFFGLMMLFPVSHSLGEKMDEINRRNEQRAQIVEAPKVELSQRQTLGRAYGFKIKGIKRNGRLILGGE